MISMLFKKVVVDTRVGDSIFLKAELLPGKCIDTYIYVNILSICLLMYGKVRSIYMGCEVNL